MSPRAYLLQGMESDSRALALTFSASVVGHLILLVLLVLAPSQLPGRRLLPTVVNVNLVSLPPPGVPSGDRAQTALRPETRTAKKKASSAKPPVAAAVKSVPATTQTVSVAPRKWKAKTSLKKKTFKPSKVVKSAIKKIEKETEASSQRSISAAISRLRDKVGQTEATGGAALKPAKGVKGGTGAGPGAPGGGGVMGKLTPERLLYQHEISYHILKNWVFSEELAGKHTDLEAILKIKILANGEIKKIWFEKRSGNRYLDESAYKALMKTNPLPPLPKGFKLYEVGLIFTPKGLK